MDAQLVVGDALPEKPALAAEISKTLVTRVGMGHGQALGL